MAHAKSARNATRKGAPEAPPPACHLGSQVQLHLLAVELRCALSTIIVSARVLCEQNADIDADVAVVLQRAAAGPLHSGIERIESMLRQLEGGGGAGDPSGTGCVH